MLPLPCFFSWAFALWKGQEGLPSLRGAWNNAGEMCGAMRDVMCGQAQRFFPAFPKGRRGDSRRFLCRFLYPENQFFSEKRQLALTP
jgi:hypothetical protein